MPELPEVETVRRIVGPQIEGKTVTDAEVRCPTVIAYPEGEDRAERFAQSLRGRTFGAAERRGKFLILPLDNGDRLFVHLRMTGEVLVVPPDYEPSKHTHVILTLSDGSRVFYTDMRRFGRMWYVRADEDAAVTGVTRLGPEPADDCLTAKYLRGKLSRRHMTIKEALLDQSVVAGIGNIYSDEVLFEARVYPETPCASLTAPAWRRIAAAIPMVVARAVEENATTPEDYLAGGGREYRNTPFLKVYGHAGKPCPVCGRTLQKIVIAARSSVFCPKCQKPPRPRKPEVCPPGYEDNELPFP